MNKVYRLVWSHVAAGFVPVAETATCRVGHRANSRRRTQLILAAMLVGLAPMCTQAAVVDVQWAGDYPSYAFPTDPAYNFDQRIDTGDAYTIDMASDGINSPAGTELNILGPLPTFPDFSQGNGASSTTVTVADALSDSGTAQAGRITVIESTDSQGNKVPITSANVDDYFYSINPANPQQNQELNVEVPGLDGSFEVVSVYDSDSFIPSGDDDEGDEISNLSLPVYDPDSVRILNDFGIVRVGGGGGTANINVGADTTSDTPIAAPTNSLVLLAKNSALAYVAPNTGETGTANWISDNFIHFRPALAVNSATQPITTQTTQYNYDLTLPRYEKGLLGRVTLRGQETFEIRSAKDIATVNDFLLGQGLYAGEPQVQYWLTAGADVQGQVIDSTAEAQTVYNTIIQNMLDTAEKTSIYLVYKPWDDQQSHSNNAILPTGGLQIIYATGANASGTVTEEGSLAVDGATAVMQADNGATITNNGAINAWRSSLDSPVSIAMYADNATAINNGVLNAGLFLEKTGENQNVKNAGSWGIFGVGNSTITNTGHINIAITDRATNDAYGIGAGGTTNITNAAGGTIAIVGNANNRDGKGGAYGVLTVANANFTNQGAMYVGSTPIINDTAPQADNLVGCGDFTAAIASLGDGTVLNDTTGQITLMEKTRNAAGILVNGGGATVTNAGNINVLGQLVNGAAAGNYGMYVKDNTGTVTNSGDIQVDGDNNIALRVLAQTANAQITSTDSSNLIIGADTGLGGTDGNPYSYRNYAVYAEGLNNHAATVQLDSTVRLLSAGAIGVHARGDATINIGAPASLTFENTDQIGYYAWGQGANINLANTTITDAGQDRSILFVVDDGATFTGATTGGDYNLSVAGTGSTGVFANGVDTANGSVATNMTTGNAQINVSGQNAVGVKVTGGAVGTISDGAINLNGDNTTAVQVDGRNYSINGDIGSFEDALDTNVTSDANIGSAVGQNGIVGYNVSYKGNLLLNSGADIALNGNDSTGVLLHDSGIATINSNVSVAGTNNIGVDIQNAGQLTNNGAITVSGAEGSGNVGVRVLGAGAIVNQLGEVTANGGLAAVQLTGDGANLTVNGTGNHISASGGADGVLIDSTGASSFTASNTVIDITDSGAGINNNADSSNINLTDVTINADDGPAIRTAVTFAAEGTGNVLNVNGSGSGFAFMQADGSATDGDLTIGTGYTINGNGTGSRGILARTSGNVTSGTDITMGSDAGAAIEATNAASLTNNGTIQTRSDTGSTILAQNTGSFTNTDTITSSSTSNSQSLIDLSGDITARTINNSGTITSLSENATVIDATGNANNTLTNSGSLMAASSTAKVIALGSGADNVTLTDGAQQTQGEILMGSGSDQFNWSGGSLTGGVTFEGADGQDTATVGTVNIANTTHILNEGSSGSTLTFNGTSGTIGTLAADDLMTGTNIGTGWSTLTLNGDPTDIRVADDLTLSGTPVINVNNGATLRSGNSVSTPGQASIHNYNISTLGADSLVSFDGNEDQIYSGVISGTGGMERVSGRKTTLLGDNTYTGDTLIGGDAELSLGDGGTVGSLSEQTNITDNGILSVNHSDEVSLNGVISGNGSFRQIGTGITRLGGANSYIGPTDVQQGTLLINGVQSGTGVTTVYSGSTLGGYGTIGGDAVFQTGTALKPGDDGRGNGTGILTVNGNLTLASDTNSQFQLGEVYTPGGALNDLVDVKGDLTLDGDLNVTLTEGGSFLPGVYRLFNYGGTLTNNTMNIASLPPHDAENYGIQTNIDEQVNLVLNFVDPSNQLQFWDGDYNGENHGDGISGNDKVDGGFGYWTALISGSSNNWTQPDGDGNAPWAQRSFAVFQGTADEVRVSDIFGPVLTSGMQFTTDGYTLVTDTDYPDSQLRFIATNPPTTFTPDNSYESQGATHADSYFAIRVGDGAAGADITTTIDVDLVQNALEDGNIRLLKTDPGRLILTGNNLITGGVEVWNGTLNINNDNALGDTSNSVLLKNGASFQAGADLTTSRLFFVDGAGGGTFDTYGNTFTPTGVIGGDGPLTIKDTSSETADGQLVLNTANTYLGNTTVKGKNGSGTLTVNANATGAFGKQDSTVALTDDARVNFNNSASSQAHTFTVNNSTLAFNNSASAGQSTIGLTGGTLNFGDSSNAGSANIAVDAMSRMVMSGNADGGTSVTTNAGSVAFAGNAQAANARIVNQSGANVTLADATSTTSIGSLSGEGAVNLSNKTLSEGNLNLNDTISGLISGVGGGLEKVGTGILTLTADNTFTGATSVLKGVLLINGDQSAATGATTVASNATLGGEGTLGANVSVANDGHLTPGKDLNSVGILTMNDLSLASNAQLDFQFGKSNVPDAKDPLNDLLVVNGDLTLDGKLNITQTPGGNFDVGVYRVINYSGNLINNSLLLGTVPDAANQLYVQTSVANQVNLVNTTGLLLNFWDGTGGVNGRLKNNGTIDGGDGIWQNSAGNDNWSTDQTDPDGSINAPFSDGAFAIFSGRKGDVTVDNSLGEVLISGAQFASNGYVINDGVITTNTADTVIRVGDGTALGRLYTATINSAITGSGGINKTDQGTLVLNGNNSYRGGTTVGGGVLQVSGDQNLGAAGTGITLNGGTFRYGEAFDTARAWTLSGDGGTIDTHSHDVSLLSDVSGSGGLTKAGDGTLTLTQDSRYSGLTTIRNGTLQLGNGGSTGSATGNILNLDTLVVNRNNTVNLDGVITGTGNFIQRGSGTTVLNGLNNWSGYTLVENGTLLAGGIARLSAQSTHIVSQNATLDTGGHSQTVSNLVNQGTVNLRGGNVGSTLRVNGDYVGMDGTINIAAQQNSPGVADKLVINGGTASGTTRLDIDVSRLGEPTTGDGIMVVQALNGATTTAQTTKDAFNIGGDRLYAGAWQYQLFAGNASGAGEDWFLRAGYSPVVPGFNTVASITRQADLYVLGTLHQRVGDEQPWRADVPQDQEGRFWARYLTKSVDLHLDDATHSKSHSQYDGMQMGLDLWQNDQWRTGIYTTFMDIDSSVSGNTGMGGGSAYNSTFSTYVGGYATWTDTNGFYVDNVLQYGYHSVDLKNLSDSQTYHPDGNTVTASVEVGKPWQLGDSNWAFEPQAQLVWQWSDFDDVTLNDGADTHVGIDADSAVIGRIGARLTADYDTNVGKVKPYVRVNFWKELTDGDDAVTYRNGSNSNGKTTLKANQQFSATEAAIGATWTVTNDVQAYTEVGRTWDNGDSTNVDANISASVGMKIRF